MAAKPSPTMQAVFPIVMLSSAKSIAITATKDYILLSIEDDDVAYRVNRQNICALVETLNAALDVQVDMRG